MYTYIHAYIHTYMYTPENIKGNFAWYSRIASKAAVLEPRQMCQYLYFCANKCVSICTFVLKNAELEYLSFNECLFRCFMQPHALKQAVAL
jgi:hypothetical protein